MKNDKSYRNLKKMYADTVILTSSVMINYNCRN